MKKLNKLKINEIAKNNLSHLQMKEISGGGILCSCSCYWEDNGGSSVRDNCLANDSGSELGYGSIYGSTKAFCRNGEVILEVTG